jgi:hypothetical protein
MVLRCVSPNLAMKLTSLTLVRSGLGLAMATADLLAAAPSRAYTGCVLSGWGGPQTTATGKGTGDLLSAIPDGQARTSALTGLGAIAALATGGLVVARHRELARVAAPDPRLASEIQTETVLLGEPEEIETEVALAYRR